MSKIPTVKPTSVDLGFKVDDSTLYSHIDIKHPVRSEILWKQGQTINI